MRLNDLFLFFLIFGCLSCEDNPSTSPENNGYININDTRHYYELSGRGDTLVVLHGGPGLSHQYLKEGLDELLSSKFTLLYYDQRGSGWTDGEKDTSNLTIDQFVQDLDQICNHFQLSEVNLLGHSFGGILAMYYAVTFPNRVNSLILVDPDAASYALRTPYQVKMINERLNPEQNAFLDSLEQTVAFKDYEPEVYESYYKTFLTSYFANPADTALLYLGFDTINVPKISHTNSIVRAHLGDYDIHHKLPKINCKTLILQGTESVFSVEGAQAIHKKIPQSEIHLFEDCGHFEYLEKPEQFKSLIFSFYGR